MSFGLWATKSKGVGLLVQLVSKISNLCDPDPPTSQTDRQMDRRTDGRTTCNLNRASASRRSRGKNHLEKIRRQQMDFFMD